jgi:hypothetical protein
VSAWRDITDAEATPAGTPGGVLPPLMRAAQKARPAAVGDAPAEFAFNGGRYRVDVVQAPGGSYTVIRVQVYDPALPTVRDWVVLNAVPFVRMEVA